MIFPASISSTTHYNAYAVHTSEDENVLIFFLRVSKGFIPVNVDVILKFLISVILTLNVSTVSQFRHQHIRFSVTKSGCTSTTGQADSQYTKIVLSFATTV